jgi:thiol:disulfide interchange protein DsbD
MWAILPFLIASLSWSQETAVTYTEAALDSTRYQVVITIPLQDQEILIKDTLTVVSNVPDSTIEWTSDKPATQQYIPSYKRSLIGYTNNPTLNVTITHPATVTITKPMLHIGYMTSLSDTSHLTTIPLKNIHLSPNEPSNSKEVGISYAPAEPETLFQRIELYISSFFEKAKNSIKDLVTTTESPVIRLLLVFIMGVLMSLTPCIYPMIPITVGILQTSASKSLLKNFLLALSYTFGQATTFAMLGFLAATGSTQFGMLLGNPYFVLFLVAFLSYMAFSMFGLYEIYIPNFLQSNNTNVKGGSFISAFVFGAISGSVASPCLSPGLLLLLSIVATLGNIFLGIAMLFCFGLGTAFPLLIIGTFSSSLSVLPQAGMWMVEVKKIFGFMLITMCFYYLSAILSWHIVLALFACFLLVLGIWTLITVQPWYGKAHKMYCYIIGILLLIGSTFVGYQAIKAFLIQEDTGIHWHTSYDAAKEKALASNGFVLLDFGASWCTACKEIEHKILQHPQVKKALSHIAIAHIDCTNPAAESCAQIQKDYAIKGYPTLILVDPTTNQEMKRWGAEALELGVNGFIHDVTLCCAR